MMTMLATCTVNVLILVLATSCYTEEKRISLSLDEIRDAGIAVHSFEDVDELVPEWMLVAELNSEGEPTFQAIQGAYQAISTERSGIREYIYLGVSEVHTLNGVVYLRSSILAGKRQDDGRWILDYSPLLILLAPEGNREIRVSIQRDPTREH